MKKKDIKKIIRIMASADGGCSNCAISLIVNFQDKFKLNKALITKLTKEIVKEEDHYWEEEINDMFGI